MTCLPGKYYFFFSFFTGTRQWRLDSEDTDDGILNSDVCDGIAQPNVELLDVPDITHMVSA